MWSAAASSHRGACSCANVRAERDLDERKTTPLPLQINPDSRPRSTSYESSLKQTQTKETVTPGALLRLEKRERLQEDHNGKTGATLVGEAPLFSHKLLLLVTSTGFRSC